MSRLLPGKLHVSFQQNVRPEGPATPRRYTLTHSDSTGDLFLTIGAAYQEEQIAGWYTRLMRDEVLAEWQTIQGSTTFERIFFWVMDRELNLWEKLLKTPNM